MVKGTVSDNTHDILSWDIRAKLRPVNIAPEVLYKTHKVPTFVRPVLARSLVTNHCMPYSFNETTTEKRHGLLQYIPIHHYSQKNGLAMSKGERVMKFKYPGISSKDLLLTKAPS